MFLSQRRAWWFPIPREADGADGGKHVHLLFLHRVCAERKIRVLQKYSSGSS